MKRLILLVILAVLGGAWYLALPPAPRVLTLPAGTPEPVRGAFHVHTNRSDGTGTIEEIAAAAARAGLKFVVLTDHGDGTRPLVAPGYYSGVLMIDAAEISTEGGHVVALDLPQTPYPLGGEPRDVVADINRLGGLAIPAHAESPKPGLNWVEWSAPFGGLEWLNADSQWRDEPWTRMVRALFTYPWRPAATLGHLLDRPDTLLRRWDVLTGRRRVAAVAAVDAHARIALRSGGGDPYDEAPALHLPAYEYMLSAFTNVLDGVTLTGDSARDARLVIDAIRNGHVYSVIDSLARPGQLSFVGATGAQTVAMGEATPARDVMLRVTLGGPDDAAIALLHNGATVASARGTTLEFRATEPGAYRVEVSLPGAPGTPPVPWIVSNPIYVGRDSSEAALPDPHKPATAFAALYENGPAAEWTVEQSAESKGALDVVGAVAGTQLLLRYALGGTASSNPYVALVAPAGPAFSGYDRLMFTARASQPMRISVQFRMPGGEIGQRWHRSVYLDDVPRTISVYFDDIAPRGPTATRRPVLSEIRDVMWVLDLVNTPLGGSGQVFIDDVKLAR